MSKYSVIASHIVDDFVWNIYEHATDQIIDSYYFEEDAREMVEFFERGGAFDGFTPSFMTTMVTVKNDLNEAFSNKFMV